MGRLPDRPEAGQSEEDPTLREWIGYTPHGRRLVVRRENEAWLVNCGDGDPVRHELLDLALIEAIRNEDDVSMHSVAIDYGEWTRRIADGIQRALLRPE